MGHDDRPVEEHPEGLAQRDKTNPYVTGRGGGPGALLPRAAVAPHLRMSGIARNAQPLAAAMRATSNTRRALITAS